MFFKLLFVLFLTFADEEAMQSEPCLRPLLNINTEPAPNISQLQFFEPIVDSQLSNPIRQILMPNLKFNCSGIITSYSALTVFRAGFGSLAHDITFSVWRPTGRGVYTVVGRNVLSFHGTPDSFAIDSSVRDRQYFQFTDKAPSDNFISFQPEDIVGWEVDQGWFGIDKPLSMVYREVSDPQEGFDFLSTFTPFDTPCALSECDSSPDANVTMISGVLPYFSIQYNKTESIPSVLGECDSSAAEECAVDTTVPSQTTTISEVPSSCSGIECSETLIMIATPIIGGLILLIVVLIILVAISLCCVNRQRRGKFLLKVKGQPDYQLEDNPTYASAENIVHTNNHHLKSSDDLHIESENGALYAIPKQVRDKKSTSALFDGECYASTYQTNGQCHIYQELPEASKTLQKNKSSVELTDFEKPPQRNRSKSAFTGSHEVLKSRPTIPLRVTPSSASVSRFPYTMPSTPAISVFDQSNFALPYVESTPFSASTIDTKSNLTSFPYTDSRPNVGSPYLETKPSVSTMPSTPDESPPSSATLESGASTGVTIRKLFHGMDDEVLNVPSASERQEFQALENPDEIYSRLKHAYKNRDSVDVVFLDQSSDTYWVPACETTQLYDQLAQRKFREIQRKQIRVKDCIGGGNFGTVYKGEWQVPGGVVDVAVKTLNPESRDDNETKFLREAAIMGQFLHPNVVKLLGVVTVGEPLMIVLELMPKGDLKQYLRNLNYASVTIKEELPSRLLSFCRQIGYGMNYLANKAFVHRDLAARNILLTEDLTCKIGDFGMSRDLEEEPVYFSQGGKMPLRWTAPEALKYHQFSSASDVWSYGMLLFEIWSLGKKPFDGILTKRLMSLVYTGFCQAPPPGCPRAIYKLMVDCWHTQAEKRITFSKICITLKDSNESLLAWSNEDSTVSARVRDLGAPLHESKKLYMDLQYTYSNSMV